MSAASPALGCRRTASAGMVCALTPTPPTTPSSPRCLPLARNSDVTNYSNISTIQIVEFHIHSFSRHGILFKICIWSFFENPKIFSIQSNFTIHDNAGQERLVELEGNLLGWSVVSSEMNITARLSLQPHNILFPLEITVEKFGRIMSNSKQDHIRIRYSTIQFQPADKLTLHQHLQNREKVNVFELQPPRGKAVCSWRIFFPYLYCKLYRR